jgi:TPR repeat protein
MKSIVSLLLLVPAVIQADDYCKAFQAYESGDLVTASATIDPLAFKGDTKAQNLRGLISLEKGANAVGQKWLQNAAVKGDLKAAYNLGYYYYHVLGNSAQAEKWMHKAEALNEAKLALGFLYTMKDMNRAKAYLYSAAQENNSFARSHLCAILNNEPGRDNSKYEQLCRGNEVEASYVTGKFYTSIKYASTAKAIYYLQYAADKGDAKAMNLLGEMLYKRHGPSDEEKALEYFVRSSTLGNIDAKVNAAWIYYVGKKWTRKPKLGFIQLNEAYQKGHAKAQFYMGILKIRGFTFSFETVRQDQAGGIADIKRSAAQNDPDALEYLIKNGIDTEKYRQQLIKHNRQADKESTLHYLSDEC